MRSNPSCHYLQAHLARLPHCHTRTTWHRFNSVHQLHVWTRDQVGRHDHTGRPLLHRTSRNHPLYLNTLLLHYGLCKGVTAHHLKIRRDWRRGGITYRNLYQTHQAPIRRTRKGCSRSCPSVKKLQVMRGSLLSRTTIHTRITTSSIGLHQGRARPAIQQRRQMVCRYRTRE